jgi:superfamily II DNA or RNA helicase
MRTPRRSAPAEEKSLLDQWVAQLSVFLGIEPKGIGRIGAGKRAPTARLDVVMIQSLVRKDSVADTVGPSRAA